MSKNSPDDDSYYVAANQEVTDAITDVYWHHEELIRKWERVMKAEETLAHYHKTPDAERQIATAGAATAKQTLCVLRALIHENDR